MTELEKRQELKQIIMDILWAWYRSGHIARIRAKNQPLSERMQELIAETNCPFDYKELEAYKYGNIYPERIVLEDRQRHSAMFKHRGPIIQRPNITVERGQQMDEWFDGYEVEQ